MTSADLAEIERLPDPDSADNVLGEAGHYAVLPAVLASARSRRIAGERGRPGTAKR